jgi:hypothetical protein
MVLIVVNTIILSLDRYPLMPKEDEEVLSYFNIVFTVMFTFEAVIKIVGLGMKEFCADKFNIFDAAIVAISLVRRKDNICRLN